jgi:hypothetical protein
MNSSAPHWFHNVLTNNGIIFFIENSFKSKQKFLGEFEKPSMNKI